MKWNVMQRTTGLTRGFYEISHFRRGIYVMLMGINRKIACDFLLIFDWVDAVSNFSRGQKICVKMRAHSAGVGGGTLQRS
jgi:hypothetical protein